MGWAGLARHPENQLLPTSGPLPQPTHCFHQKLSPGGGGAVRSGRLAQSSQKLGKKYPSEHKDPCSLYSLRSVLRSDIPQGPIVCKSPSGNLLSRVFRPAPSRCTKGGTPGQGGKELGVGSAERQRPPHAPASQRHLASPGTAPALRPRMEAPSPPVDSRFPRVRWPPGAPLPSLRAFLLHPVVHRPEGASGPVTSVYSPLPLFRFHSREVRPVSATTGLL